MSPFAPCAPALAGHDPPELPFWRAVATAVAVLGTTMLPLLLTASQAVEIQDDLSFGDGRLGVAVGIFWAAVALASSPAGRVADAIGGGRGVRIGAALAAAGSLGIAVAAEGYAVFVALLALIGAGLALVAPGMSALVSGQLRPGRLGVVLGFQQSGPPAASLVAGLALPAVATGGGWRWTFGVAALLILGAAATVATDDCSLDRQCAGTSRPPGIPGLAVAGGLAAAAASAGITFLVPDATSVGLSSGQAGTVLAGAALATIVVRVGLGAAFWLACAALAAGGAWTFHLRRLAGRSAPPAVRTAG
jgi:MFS family permease